MKVVANSSILIALAAMGRLSLLRQRFPEGIMIPQAVWHEVVESGRGKPGAQVVATTEWITCQPVQKHDFVDLLQGELIGAKPR